MELEFDKLIILASYAVVIVLVAYMDNWVQDFKSWPNFGATFAITQQLSNLIRQYSTGYLNLFVVGSFLAVTALCMRKKGNLNNDGDELIERTELDMFADDDEYFAANDAKYKKMEPREDMFTYVLVSDGNHFSYRTGNGGVYSFDEEPNFNPELVNFEHKIDNSSLFCEICLDDKESSQMFKNDKCSHSFCSECTTSYIITKIQDRAKAIACPSVNCKATLNPDACRLMIPETTLAKWDELQCLSLIPESSKLYCPYRDCLAMLVIEYAETVNETKCVACKRWFCAKCGVPRHMRLTCEEFQKLNRKKGEKDDEIVKMLAMKKNWQRCPQCKMYVEKIQGCVHMTCRCEYEFCYRCGSEWSHTHENNCMKLQAADCIEEGRIKGETPMDRRLVLYFNFP